MVLGKENYLAIVPPLEGGVSEIVIEFVFAVHGADITIAEPTRRKLSRTGRITGDLLVTNDFQDPTG